MVDRIKVYGERNTGTNFVERCLRQMTSVHVIPGNLPPGLQRFHKLISDILPRETANRLIEGERDRLFRRSIGKNLGWKHARTPVGPMDGSAYPAGVGIVTLRKNPYSWLLSLHRRPYAADRAEYRAHLPFAEFVKMPWPTRTRENGPPFYETPMDLWCDKVASYALLDAIAPTAHLTYEEVLRDPARSFRTVSADLDIPLVTDGIDLQTATKRDPSSFEHYKRYYLGEEWRAKLDPETVEFINAHLDADLVARSGYRIIEPSELKA